MKKEAKEAAEKEIQLDEIPPIYMLVNTNLGDGGYMTGSSIRYTKYFTSIQAAKEFAQNESEGETLTWTTDGDEILSNELYDTKYAISKIAITA